jgi:hypothetical protein
VQPAAMTPERANEILAAACRQPQHADKSTCIRACNWKCVVCDAINTRKHDSEQSRVQAHAQAHALAITQYRRRSSSNQLLNVQVR